MAEYPAITGASNAPMCLKVLGLLTTEHILRGCVLA
jgi:hypothetical protein